MRSILLITPPLTQLNTPYPATAYLKGYLNAHGQKAEQADLGIELVDRVLSSGFLSKIGMEREAGMIETVKRFLRGEDDTLGPRIVNRSLLPEGKHFAQTDDLEWAFGVAGTTDKAQHLATLFIEEIADHIREHVDSHFDLVRYAEHLSNDSPAFDPLYKELNAPASIIDKSMLSILREKIEQVNPEMICFSVPFPGCLYGALKCAQWVKANTDIKVEIGGGFVNTEWRQISDPRIFEFADYITLDDGEVPLLRIAEGKDLVRTFTRDGYHEGGALTESEINASTECCPDFTGLPLKLYLSMTEMTNPMHRLWSQGRWNKMMMAHGCYWAKCVFCDTTLDYIGRYQTPTATKVVDDMEHVMQQTGQSGFHFVDEALPPKLLKDVSEEIIRRRLTLSFWGNIRFEKAYSAELCDLLADAGCIAVSGGLEVASDRLLRLINKGVTIRQTIDACRHFRDAGIMVHTYLMYGFPTETLQESADALDTVRGMFDEGIVQSAFWHRYAMTCHSRSGLHPEDFGAKRICLKPNPFCNNEVDWLLSDLSLHSPASAQFSYDIDAVGDALRIATYNFMNGLGLDQPAKKWFSQFGLHLPGRKK